MKLKKISTVLTTTIIILSILSTNVSALHYNEGRISAGFSSLIPENYSVESLVTLNDSSNPNDIWGYNNSWNYYSNVITADGVFHQLIETYDETIITVKDIAFPLDEINKKLSSEELPVITQNEDGTYLFSYLDAGRESGDEAYAILKEYYEIESIQENCYVNVNTGEKTDIIINGLNISTRLTPEKFEEKHSEIYEKLELTSTEGWSYNSEINMYDKYSFLCF